MNSKTRSSIKFSTAIFLILVNSLILTIKSAPTPSPTSDADMLKCTNKLGAACDDSIYKYVFATGERVSKECCNMLLGIEKDCRDLLTILTKHTIVYLHLTEKQGKEVLRKNDQVWDLCKTISQISY